MISLHYQDGRERAEAILSIARQCQVLAARLVFFGPETACEEVRRVVCELDSSALLGLTFRPLRRPEQEQSADGWNATVESIRSALLETSIIGSPMVAWIESPVPPHGIPLRPALRAYYQTLDVAPASGTVIGAYRFADLPEGAHAGLLEACEAVLNAKSLLPSCSSWLIHRNHVPDSLTPAAGASEYSTGSALELTTFGQLQKLAALGQLAAGVVHELGNPLSIISSSLQYLHQRLAAAKDPGSDFTMTALANVERMHGLLRSMLDFAAVKKPSFEQADLKEIISEVLRFTAAECLRRSITVEVSFDPSVSRAWVEPSGIKQIVLNLVKNSLDAMVQGGDRLQVHTRMAQGDLKVIVEIANNGPPIPDDVRPHLFRPFHTTKDGGTGLGLYLSRQIAQDHGGDLEAENLPQGGVQFTLTLPVDRRRKREHGAYPDRR